MRVLINPNYFKKEQFTYLQKQLPELEFSNDFNDPEVDIYITWASGVKKVILEKLPQLKLILLPSAGYDKADLEYVKQRGIILTNAKTVYDIQIAEHVLANMLYINRDLACYQQLQIKHQWQPHNQFYEIYGKTVGIIGAGSIGQRIAKLLKGFDTHVIGYRRQLKETPYFDDIVTDDKGLNRLLQQSDYVILAIPLSSQTHHLMNEQRLRSMKKDALLINIARGKVIDEEALIKALNQGWIRGACIDVATQEPMAIDHPLWDAKHVFITPHIAGRSPEANARINTLFKQIIEAYMNHKPIMNRIC